MLVALMDFGDKHRAGAGGPPVALHHRDCGEPIYAHLTCGAGHEIEPATRAELIPLAGARLLAQA